jgi:hypothetical protein
MKKCINILVENPYERRAFGRANNTGKINSTNRTVTGLHAN